MTSNEFTDFKDALGISESSGQYYNDYKNCWGKYQFCDARRRDIERLLGLPHLTREQFTPEMQEKFFQVHINDIEARIHAAGLDKYIGARVTGQGNGITEVITLQGLIAGAHLGGFGGLVEYFKTGGSYDPADDHGTHISDYIVKFSKKKIS